MYKNPDAVHGDGDDSIMMRDEDGSLTGVAGVTVVQPNMYYTKDMQCTAKEGWNLNICHENFAKVYILQNTNHMTLKICLLCD